MAHIERINWTDSVPDAVAKIAEGNIGAAVCIMDLMKHSEEIPFELPKSNRTRYAVRQPWDIWTKRMGNIQRRLRTEPCKNARSAACHTVGHAAKHCWRFQTGSTEMKEK
jgi:hypothetical protein